MIGVYASDTPMHTSRISDAVDSLAQHWISDWVSRYRGVMYIHSVVSGVLGFFASSTSSFGCQSTCVNYFIAWYIFPYRVMNNACNHIRLPSTRKTEHRSSVKYVLHNHMNNRGNVDVDNGFAHVVKFRCSSPAPYVWAQNKRCSLYMYALCDIHRCRLKSSVDNTQRTDFRDRSFHNNSAEQCTASMSTSRTTPTQLIWTAFIHVSYNFVLLFQPPHVRDTSPYRQPSFDSIHNVLFKRR